MLKNIVFLELFQKYCIFKTSLPLRPSDVEEEIFNFHKAYFILEELIVGGFIMESSKKQVLKMVS